VRASEFEPVVELESPLVQELVENSRQLCRLKRLLQEGTRTVFSRALAMFRLLAGGNEYNMPAAPLILTALSLQFEPLERDYA
jgi:hypothetical protein